MPEVGPPPQSLPAEVTAPPWLVALMDAHGAAVYRYCAAMLGVAEADVLLPELFALVHEHAPQAADDERSRVLYTMAHNRCMARSREGGRPPKGEGLEGEAQTLERAVAQLRPFGRDALLLRVVVGLTWAPMESVCNAPRHRLSNRVARAWRIVGHHYDAGGRSPVDGALRRPAGVPVGTTDASWAPIREDARKFVALRHGLRQRWHDVWPQRDWRRRVEEILVATAQREHDRVCAEREAAQHAQREAEQRAIEAIEHAARARIDAAKQRGRERIAQRRAATPSRTSHEPGPWLSVSLALAVAAALLRWAVYAQ